MPVTYLKETASQTAGPYVHIGLVPAFAGLKLRTQEKLHVLPAFGGAERIRLDINLFDGAGSQIKDGLVEIWQADPKGNYRNKDFQGWGRSPTAGETGLVTFETVKPGATKWPDGRMQAPHISVLVFARGINIQLHTRLYFPDEEAANAEDPVLKACDGPHLAKTMIARRDIKDGQVVYTHDIHLQGDKETVFLDM